MKRPKNKNKSRKQMRNARPRANPLLCGATSPITDDAVKDLAFLDLCSSVLRYLMILNPEMFSAKPVELTPQVEPDETIQ